MIDSTSIFIILVTCIPLTYIYFKEKKDSDKRKVLDDKYNVDKFPVTSSRGNQYYVKIRYNHEGLNKFTCSIYKRISDKNNKIKDKLLSHRGIDLDKLKFDYIKVVKIAVEGYEKDNISEIIKNKQERETLSANKKLFNQWDGRF